ncbi:MAG: GLPGLI family protein [Bacteroidota bacterium]
MRKLNILLGLFFIAALLIFNKSFSQQTQGSVKYLTSYDWVKMINSCDYLSNDRKDKAAYLWGNRSEWKQFNNLYFSPLKSKYENSDENAEPEQDDGYAGRKETFYITRNFGTNTFLDAIEMLGKTYIVTDSLKAPDWKILNDIKEIAGHVCMNATYTDTLLHQKIVAWFALDIPIQAGPDRFFGLPGLILEVTINNGAKIMTAQSIDMKTFTTEFDLPKKLKGKAISGSAYAAILKKFLDEKRKAEEFPWGINY